MHRALAHFRFRTFLLPLVLVAVPAPLAGQDYVGQVWRQLQQEYDLVKEDDFTLQNYIIGSLSEGNTDSWTWTFEEGDRYAITGACDEDCTDLDIVVEDSRGNVVARDELSDDVPFVTFRPNRTGAYTVKVNMYQCSEEPCYFGFGVFYR